MKLGISTWSLPWSVGVPGYPQPARPLGAVDLVAKASDLGVGVLQIADNLPLHALTEAELGHLAEAARHHGLALEVGTRGLDHDALVRYIDIAAQIGADPSAPSSQGPCCRQVTSPALRRPFGL